MVSLAALLAGLAGIGLGQWPAAARGADPPGAYKADSPEPTPLETLMLEYINRCRANPAEDAVALLPRARGCPPAWTSTCSSGRCVAKPAPPLVFDLALLKAARWHSYYQVCNEAGARGGAGEAGVHGPDSCRDRITLAGFTGGAVGENCCRERPRTLVLPLRLRGRLGPPRARRHAAQTRPSQQHPQSRIPPGRHWLRPLAGRRRTSPAPRSSASATAACSAAW